MHAQLHSIIFYYVFFQPFFAFEFKEKYGHGEDWKIYDPIKELRRMVSFVHEKFLKDPCFFLNKA